MSTIDVLATPASYALVAVGLGALWWLGCASTSSAPPDQQDGARKSPSSAAPPLTESEARLQQRLLGVEQTDEIWTFRVSRGVDAWLVSSNGDEFCRLVAAAIGMNHLVTQGHLFSCHAVVATCHYLSCYSWLLNGRVPSFRTSQSVCGCTHNDHAQRPNTATTQRPRTLPSSIHTPLVLTFTLVSRVQAKS